jgi:hypothetical protein
LEFLQHLFNELKIVGQWNEEANTFYGSAQVNTWSRSARRAKFSKVDVQETPIPWKASGGEDLFEFTCSFQPWNVSTHNTRLTVSWTNGKDRNIFESFYLHIKKRLEQEFSSD